MVDHRNNEYFSKKAITSVKGDVSMLCLSKAKFFTEPNTFCTAAQLLLL